MISRLKNFKEIIEKNRPKIQPSTVQGYLSCLKTIIINSDLGLNTLEDFVTKYEEVLDFMSSIPPSARKTKLASIVVLLDDKHNDMSYEREQALKAYREQMSEDGKKTDDQLNKQELSDKQKENFIPWEDVMKIYENLKLRTQGLWRVEHLTKAEFNLLQDFVILSCYVLIPPRRSEDYISFKIDNVNEDTDNYMNLGNKRKKAQFVFNKYKNASKVGPQSVEIPNELKNIILKWKEISPYDYLIVSNVGTKIPANRLTVILNRIFKKKISTSLLRHIYLTHKFGDVDIESMDKIANEMGSTGIRRMLQYVDKNKGEEKESEVEK